jgi:chorismate lyase
MTTSTLTWCAPSQPPADCPPQQWNWLTFPGSLTARLREISGQTTRIELLQADWGEALPEEITLFTTLTEKKFWVREILHLHHQEPWVWARALIPNDTLQKTHLDGHTAQPIGDILFHDPHLTRTEFTWARLSGDHPYYHRAIGYACRDAPTLLWARRSLLWYQQQPLFIAEVFLPKFLMYTQRE